MKQHTIHSSRIGATLPKIKFKPDVLTDEERARIPLRSSSLFDDDRDALDERDCYVDFDHLD